MDKVVTKNELVKYNSLIIDNSVFFEKNATPLMIVNKDRVMVRLNHKFAELFGYKKDELLGRQTIILTPTKKMFHEYAEHFQKTKNRTNIGKEFQYKRKDGSLFWVKLDGNLIYEKDSEILIMWTFMDVTQEVIYREKLKHLASIDPMTQLYNRRYFYDVVQHITDVAKREKTNVSIAMIDIDFFKNINDQYGHQVGDKVIIKLSNLLLEMTRQSDIVCRFGGEEFLVLLPNNEDGAFDFAEQIRKKVFKTQMNLENKKFNFTVSIGTSLINLEQDLNSSINIADKALYRAKNMGRNIVCKAIKSS
jgi:diguanylate cyclase (GGDEF)-like protein/PAS domain S-box-containing protein